MNKRYLLTYDKQIPIVGYSIKTYEWFEDEEEMEIFIDDYDIKPIEKLYIADADQL